MCQLALTAAELTKETVASIAALMDREAIGVVHADLGRADLDAMLKLQQRFQKLTQDQLERKIRLGNYAPSFFAEFKGAGVTHAFGLVSLADIEELSVPLIMPVEPGKDPQVAARLLGKDTLVDEKVEQRVIEETFGPEETTAILDGVVVSGKRHVVDRMRQVLKTQSGRSDSESLMDALDSVGKVPIHFILWPSEEHRRIIREMVPVLHRPLDGISGEIIADGIRWAAIGLDPVAAEVYVVARSENEVAAARLALGIERGLNVAATLPKAKEAFESAHEDLSILKPLQDGSTLKWQLDLESAQVEHMVRLLISSAGESTRASAHRIDRLNRLRRIALAMMIHEDEKGTYPLQAIMGDDGKPLLSWRVAILPYLEGGAELYEQFHLDEPWDSPHNSKLLAQMPEDYADPALPELAAEGNTTYQVPAHEESAFPPGVEGIGIGDIRDGTSKTAMVVEVIPARAVPWTKPEDWNVVRETPHDGVARTDRKEFSAAYCDGSVHTIPVDIDPQMLWQHLTRAGGEPGDG
jgi:hypothetical protein